MLFFLIEYREITSKNFSNPHISCYFGNYISKYKNLRKAVAQSENKNRKLFNLECFKLLEAPRVGPYLKFEPIYWVQ